MSIEKVYDGQMVCKCERCSPPKIWMPKGNKMPKTCPQCRSELWNKKKPQVKVLKSENAPQAALQCAIIYGFDCEYYRQKVPAAVLCKVCFTLPVWKDKKTIAGIKEAFSTTPEDEPDLALEAFVDEANEIEIEKAIEGTDDKVIQAKTPEQILNELETREVKEPELDILRNGELPPVTGGSKTEKKKDEKLAFTAAARTCGTKEIDASGVWTCNFFTMKSKNPPFPHCRLCWELPEIWGDKAVGQ